MSNPEVGRCSIQVYERGKKFMVEPDRLCVDGLYTFAFRARPSQDWEACRLLTRVTNVKRLRLKQGYKVDNKFQDPETFRSYPVDANGFVTWHSGPAEEGYFRHHLDGANDELEAITIEIQSGSEISEVPEFAPVAIT